MKRLNHLRMKLEATVKTIFYIGVVCLTLSSCQQNKATVQTTQEEFPFFIPAEKPNRPLSAAVERNYDAYESIRPEQTELYTQFKYTELKGFDYNGGDGTITRRDPSKVIFENGKYYVWYTGRKSPVKPVGMARAKEATDVIPGMPLQKMVSHGKNRELLFLVRQNPNRDGVRLLPPISSNGRENTTCTFKLLWRQAVCVAIFVRFLWHGQILPMVHGHIPAKS